MQEKKARYKYNCDKFIFLKHGDKIIKIYLVSNNDLKKIIIDLISFSPRKKDMNDRYNYLKDIEKFLVERFDIYNNIEYCYDIIIDDKYEKKVLRSLFNNFYEDGTFGSEIDSLLHLFTFKTLIYL